MMAGDPNEMTYAEWMVERINAHPISRTDMAELVAASSSLSPEDRCFEVHAALTFRQFPGDADKSFSAMFRLMALAHLADMGNLLGWIGAR